jgi:hypothetical protein
MTWLILFFLSEIKDETKFHDFVVWLKMFKIFKYIIQIWYSRKKNVLV